MSSTLTNALRALQASNYLAAKASTQHAAKGVELLPNGKRYCKQLELQWRLAADSDDSDDAQVHFLAPETVHPSDTPTPSNNGRLPLSFINTPQFLASARLAQVRQPAIVNSIQTSMRPSATVSSHDLIQMATSSANTQLISEYFIQASRGLEKFSTIQRQRKIWWMRFSANPSRYFLEPIELHEDELPFAPSGCQSISIKSRLSFGTAAVEHVTLVPLKQNTKEEGIHFDGPPPAVIRSVIDLERATCALLFDGFDHNRCADTLLLNRLLAPYQCAVGCIQKNNTPPDALEDLHDLCKFLSFVLRRSGLRLFDKAIACSPSEYEEPSLSSDICAADRVGIPYTLLVEEESLRTGLLKLRSRNTTLAETIHISDIPDYLLHIFRG